MSTTMQNTAVFVDAHGDFVDATPTVGETWKNRKRPGEYERVAAEWIKTPIGQAWLRAKRQIRAEMANGRLAACAEFKAACLPSPAEKKREAQEKGLAELKELAKRVGIEKIAYTAGIGLDTLRRYLRNPPKNCLALDKALAAGRKLEKEAKAA